ncbi:MAG: response regulator transcription factor [Bacteroidales bacterium]|nr:response regulator transcription factor [Bacteroidales bacterium]HPD95563.1 response regulator transcription factor [Tenuifilaceae bacterium]HRX31752.1 response regulator transcription factor [Tenuifilaceae bacterium]
MDIIRVLIVDDHQIVRDGIQSILTGEPDIELIGSVGSAQKALSIIKTKNPPDVLIADLSMPDMSGIELTEHITENYPAVRVLILSMFSDEEYIVRAIQAGAKGYLPKQDSTTELLLEAIRVIYKGEDFFSPSISKVVMKSFVNSVKKAKTGDTSKKVQLTGREKEILKLYVEGFTNTEISEKLNLSVYTVKTHKNNIMQKYNFKSTVEMIKFAIKNNIVEW